MSNEPPVDPESKPPVPPAPPPPLEAPPQGSPPPPPPSDYEDAAPELPTPPSGEWKIIWIAALASMIIGLIPFITALCCIQWVLPAFLAVFFFTRSNRITISAGHGIKIGIFVVLLGGVMTLVVQDLYWLISGHPYGAELVERMMNAIADKLHNPEVRQRLQEQMARQAALGLTAPVVMMQIVTLGLLGSLVGVIAGAIGAVTCKFGKR